MMQTPTNADEWHRIPWIFSRGFFRRPLGTSHHFESHIITSELSCYATNVRTVPHKRSQLSLHAVAAAESES